MSPGSKRHVQKLLKDQIIKPHQRQQKQYAKKLGLHSSFEKKKKRGCGTESVYELATNQVNPTDIKKINRGFDDIFGRDRRQNGVFYFYSENEATSFFKSQAEMGRNSLVKKEGKDCFMFSDGQGDFFKGTQDELQNYLENSPDEDTNTSVFKP